MVRDLLDFPLTGRPLPHQIFAELLRGWQFMANQLNNTRRPWLVPGSPETVTSVAGQAEYVLTAGDFGKAQIVYRELENDNLLPVPFTDHLSELYHQSYEFWLAPFDASLSPNYAGEKVAFFRTSDNVNKMRIFPIPQESGVEYQIVYAAGALDLSAKETGDETILPEWSDYRALRAALNLLPKAEWEGLSRAENMDKRRELRETLVLNYAEQKAEFAAYISNVQQEPPGSVGHWSE